MVVDTFEAQITFISKSEGGRDTVPILDLDYNYRPHIVLGDPDQRKAVMEGNYITEPYIGVAFRSVLEGIEFNTPVQAELALVCPQPEYEDALVTGATFTLREGASIVGYGLITRSLRTTEL